MKTNLVKRKMHGLLKKAPTITVFHFSGWSDAPRSRRWSRCIGGCCCLKAARGGACLAGGKGQGGGGEEEGGGEGEKEEQEELKIDMENDFSVFYLTT